MNPGLETCAVVGGSGRVGKMIVNLLSHSGIHVICIDLVENNAQCEFALGDLTQPDANLGKIFESVDAVLLAVPEEVAIAGVEFASVHMGDGTLIIDTVSVKTRVVQCMEKYGGRLENLSINPMFAPDLDMRGRPISLTTVRDGPRGKQFCRLLESRGAQIVPMGAEQHDRVMAMCQAATHAAVLAFGITLMQSGVGVRELLKVAPPPHLTMLALLSRILAGSPAVYWEIQSVNAHAETARVQLEDSVRHVSSAAKDEESFGQLVDELRAFLGTTSSQLANIAESIFQNLNK